MVERTFEGMNRWFKAGLARYRGIEKMHTQHVLEVICHNLKRFLELLRQLASKGGVCHSSTVNKTNKTVENGKVKIQKRKMLKEKLKNN